MRALLDVNVLIALLDADHVSHRAVSDWFGAHGGLGWASCPITQNGCLRIMSHHGYPNMRSPHEIAARLRVATERSEHEFWPDGTSLLNSAQVDTTRVHSPRQLTDIYLLALAVSHNGRLVSFGKAISRDAVAGANDSHLLVL